MKVSQMTYDNIGFFTHIWETILQFLNRRLNLKIFVDGEQEIASFAGKDGNKRMSFHVVANTYCILGGRCERDIDPKAA
jgi:hypothetical protein